MLLNRLRNLLWWHALGRANLRWSRNARTCVVHDGLRLRHRRAAADVLAHATRSWRHLLLTHLHLALHLLRAHLARRTRPSSLDLLHTSLTRRRIWVRSHLHALLPWVVRLSRGGGSRHCCRLGRRHVVVGMHTRLHVILAWVLLICMMSLLWHNWTRLLIG